jgi:hypothetical protein
VQNFGGHSNGFKLLEGADADIHSQLLPAADVRRGLTVHISFPSSSHVVELLQNF